MNTNAVLQGFKVILILGLAAGCAHKPSAAESFKISDSSVPPASHVDWVGHDSSLVGLGKLKLNEPLPEMTLLDQSLKRRPLKADGKIRILSVVPSLDTPVCEQQTHILGDDRTLDSRIERVTVSRDLPYAQSRFAEESKLTNITYLSDFRTGEFGKELGLEIERNGLLARAIVVVDGQGIVRYLQIVPKITELPNMQKAFAVANSLAR